jgi:glycosyltransferase involved in cell wall biosynthesis
VSVGIPTYNRPAGLRRTLDCILGQSFTDLEVLVSDNASPDPEVAGVCEAYARADPRVRVWRHERNIGMTGNFAHVLREARGEYFMWAADDDEWRPGFIDACVTLLDQGAVSAMTGIETLYRGTETIQAQVMPAVAPERPPAENFVAFLRLPTPGMFYGLHRRACLDFVLDEARWFDYYDCYVMLRLISAGPVALDPRSLYVAGVDGGAYEVKTVGRRLRYRPFLVKTLETISHMPASPAEKLRLRAETVLATTRFQLSQWRGTLSRLARRTSAS